MAKFSKSEKPAPVQEDVIPPLPSVDDPDDELSWSQLTAVAGGIVKHLRAFEHAARVCHQASQAEQYVERAHTDLKTVLNLVQAKRDEAKKLEDNLVEQRKASEQKLEDLELHHKMIVEQKQQELKVVEDDVASTKQELESYAAQMRQELNVARKQAHQAMMKETKTVRDKIQFEIDELKRQSASVKSEVDRLQEERTQLNAIIQKTRDAIVGVSTV